MAIRDHPVKSISVTDADTEGGMSPGDLTKFPPLEAKLSIHAL